MSEEIELMMRQVKLGGMVKIIVNDFGGVNIIITSDHGFLYTYSPLSEDSKVDKTTVSDEDVEVDRRYLVTCKGAKPQYLLPVKFVADKDYDAFSPRESIRIKKKGGGLNFVHVANNFIKQFFLTSFDISNFLQKVNQSICLN